MATTINEYYRNMTVDDLILSHRMMADALEIIAAMPDKLATRCEHFDEAVRLANEALAVLGYFRRKEEK